MHKNSASKCFMPVKFIKQQKSSKPELRKNWLPLNVRHHWQPGISLREGTEKSACSWGRRERWAPLGSRTSHTSFKYYRAIGSVGYWGSKRQRGLLLLFPQAVWFAELHNDTYRHGQSCQSFLSCLNKHLFITQIFTHSVIHKQRFPGCFYLRFAFLNILIQFSMETVYKTLLGWNKVGWNKRSAWNGAVPPAPLLLADKWIVARVMKMHGLSLNVHAALPAMHPYTDSHTTTM